MVIVGTKHLSEMTSLHFSPWEYWNKFACDRFLSDYKIILTCECRAQSLICMSYIFSNSSSDCTYKCECVWKIVINILQFTGTLFIDDILSHAYGWHQYFLSQGNIFPLLRYRQNVGLKTFSETHVTPSLLHEAASRIDIISKCFVYSFWSSNVWASAYVQWICDWGFFLRKVEGGKQFFAHTQPSAYRHHFKRFLKCRVGRNSLSQYDIMLLALLYYVLRR